jgi:hypothetical protein
MRQIFLVLLLGVSNNAVSAQPLQLDTGLPDTAHQPRACRNDMQQVRQNVQTKSATEANSTLVKVPAESSLAEMPAVEVMRLARLLYVRSRSSWFNQEKLERELLKRKEFGELGLELTRKVNDANLVLEITRKTFTTRFTCSIIEPSSERIVGSATASSLGGEIEPHLAEVIIKQFKAVRSTQEKKED